jgi:hypothetical protein
VALVQRLAHHPDTAVDASASTAACANIVVRYGIAIVAGSTRIFQRITAAAICTDPRDPAGGGGRAYDAQAQIDAGAQTIETPVIVGPGVAVVASSAILLKRLGTDTGGGSADADIVTLIKGRANDAGAFICTLANSTHADIVAGCRWAVVAGCKIRFAGVAAHTKPASAREMALVGGRARNAQTGVGSSTHIVKTHIVDCGGEPVVARAEGREDITRYALS